MINKQQMLVMPAMEKPLLRLHAVMDIGSFWEAVRRIIDIVVPDSLLGLTLQHNPVLPMVARWSFPVPEGLFEGESIEKFFNDRPHRKFAPVNKAFHAQKKFFKSKRNSPVTTTAKGLCGVGLFFRRRRRLVSVIIILRSAKQGNLTAEQMNMLRQLYPQFQTALRRLGALERERTARMAFENFLGRVPLPTILLRWNLMLAYQNQAAREFCALWERGAELARVLKMDAPIPAEILETCRALKHRWERTPALTRPQPWVKQQVVYHRKWPHLRAAVSLRQLSSAGVARPHFLIECEELRLRPESERRRSDRRLAHLARLSTREQQVALLACEGRSNGEIAEAVRLSLPMVKKHLTAIFRKLEVTSRSQLTTLMR